MHSLRSFLVGLFAFALMLGCNGTFGTGAPDSGGAGAIAANTAKQCGGEAVMKLVTGYLPKVTLALLAPNHMEALNGIQGELVASGVSDGVGLLGCVISKVMGGLPAKPGAELVYAAPGEPCVSPAVGRAILPTEKLCRPSAVGSEVMPQGVSQEAVVRARARLWLSTHPSAPQSANTCTSDSQCSSGQRCMSGSCRSACMAVTCTSNSDCAACSVCQSGQCVQKTAPCLDGPVLACNGSCVDCGTCNGELVAMNTLHAHNSPGDIPCGNSSCRLCYP